MAITTNASKCGNMFTRTHEHKGQQRVLGRVGDKFVTLILAPPPDDSKNWAYWVDGVNILVHKDMPRHIEIRRLITTSLNNELQERYKRQIHNLMLHTDLINDINPDVLEVAQLPVIYKLKSVLKEEALDKYPFLK